MRRAEVLLGLLLAASSAGADEPAFRFEAPIQVEAPASFVRLPLPTALDGWTRVPRLSRAR